MSPTNRCLQSRQPCRPLLRSCDVKCYLAALALSTVSAPIGLGMSCLLRIWGLSRGPTATYYLMSPLSGRDHHECTSFNIIHCQFKMLMCVMKCVTYYREFCSRFSYIKDAWLDLLSGSFPLILTSNHSPSYTHTKTFHYHQNKHNIKTSTRV